MFDRIGLSKSGRFSNLSSLSSTHGYPERNVVVASLYCLREPRVLQIFLPGLTYSSEYTVARNPEVEVMVPHVEEEGGGFILVKGC